MKPRSRRARGYKPLPPSVRELARLYQDPDWRPTAEQLAIAERALKQPTSPVERDLFDEARRG
jgi:hypothetical protein